MNLLKPILPAMAALALLLSISCRKTDPGHHYPGKLPPPIIHTIHPDSGFYQSIVTITGENFDLDSPQNNIVKFNGKTAAIRQINAHSLTVIVPKAAGTGPVTVTVDGVTVAGPIFTYIWTVIVSTVAGGGNPGLPGGPVNGGYVDGLDSIARFNVPTGLSFGPGGIIYVADEQNTCIRKIENGTVSTFAGSIREGFVNGPAATAKFRLPAEIATDTTNNIIYVSDIQNHCIRKISAGQVTTYAGTGQIGFRNGMADTAEFYAQTGIAIDAQGNLYVADAGNSCIRKITAAGLVTTLAGNGTRGFADGADTNARFNNPTGIAVDGSGNIYVADQVNNRVRKITPAGITTTLAGTGTQGFADGPGNVAQFYTLLGVAVDPIGNVYVSDFSRIREISPNGTVTTLAGTTVRGFADGQAASAQFYFPEGLAFSSQGDLYVADGQNQRIRKITRQ